MQSTSQCRGEATGNGAGGGDVAMLHDVTSEKVAVAGQPDHLAASPSPLFWCISLQRRRNGTLNCLEKINQINTVIFVVSNSSN